MGKLSPTQQKAMAWYVEHFGLIPQLSVHPVYNFTIRETGEPKQAHIVSITTYYQERKKHE